MKPPGHSVPPLSVWGDYWCLWFSQSNFFPDPLLTLHLRSPLGSDKAGVPTYLLVLQVHGLEERFGPQSYTGLLRSTFYCSQWALLPSKNSLDGNPRVLRKSSPLPPPQLPRVFAPSWRWPLQNNNRRTKTVCNHFLQWTNLLFVATMSLINHSPAFLSHNLPIVL